jgi:hypothetical protein
VVTNELVEVHLVAMISKRGELVRSVKETGRVAGKEVPEIPKPPPMRAPDCGM